MKPTLRRPRFLVTLLLALLTLAASPGCYYLRSEPVPTTSEYDLDLPELRRLADSIDGPRPVALRRALVAVAELPGAMMMAGAAWDPVEMVHPAFQVLRADGTYLLLETVQTQAMHEGVPGAVDFDMDAWNDLVRAMGEAEQILISHEHGDHIGGAAAYPEPMELVGRLRLNEAQLGNDRWLEDVGFPETLRSALDPLVFEDAVAIAPGVVVKRAPGHTPGNQIFFLSLEDGTEILYVGDVVWNRDALTERVYRPRFITNWIIGEDRTTSIHQLAALADLYESDEAVAIVIAHDRRTQEIPSIQDGFVFSGATPPSAP